MYIIDRFFASVFALTGGYFLLYPNDDFTVPLLHNVIYEFYLLPGSGGPHFESFWKCMLPRFGLVRVYPKIIGIFLWPQKRYMSYGKHARN